MAGTLRSNEKFRRVFYLEDGGTGDGSSNDAPLDMANGSQDLMSIPAGCVIEKVYTIVDTAVTGTTEIEVGDDDDQDGFVDGSLSMTLNTPGMYGWNAKVAGAYLRVQTAGATDAADIYVVPNAKYYSATGKEIKVYCTTASTAGKVRVVVEGFYVSDNSI
jgi:hypothetical protein